MYSTQNSQHVAVSAISMFCSAARAHGVMHTKMVLTYPSTTYFIDTLAYKFDWESAISRDRLNEVKITLFPKHLGMDEFRRDLLKLGLIEPKSFNTSLSCHVYVKGLPKRTLIVNLGYVPSTKHRKSVMKEISASPRLLGLLDAWTREPVADIWPFEIFRKTRESLAYFQGQTGVKYIDMQWLYDGGWQFISFPVMTATWPDHALISTLEKSHGNKALMNEFCFIITIEKGSYLQRYMCPDALEMDGESLIQQIKFHDKSIDFYLTFETCARRQWGEMGGMSLF